MSSVRTISLAISVMALSGAGPGAAQSPPARGEGPSREPSIVERMQHEAKRLEPLVSSALGRQFITATGLLPEGEARTIYKVGPRQYRSALEVERMTARERAGLEPLELSAADFYLTRYGSPLAYSRPLDLVGAAGLTSLEGRKVLDFGYGTIGHLRLLAIRGAEVVGLDVDSFLAALYSHPRDQGPVRTAEGRKGSVTLIQGQWPGTGRVRHAVGGGYDLIISKNTLKRGYVHPARDVDPERLVHLGVDDETFCRALFEALRPGGLLIIYNLSPPQNPPDKPYLPWADGRCPFTRPRLEHAGFEVIAYDVEDHETARVMGRALEWNQGEGAMDLETGLFAHYTLLRRPKAN